MVRRDDPNMQFSNALARAKQWSEDVSLKLRPGIGRDLKILLRNVNAIPGKYQDVVLRFSSMTP